MTSKNLVLAALFAALIVVLSLMPPIPLPGIPVPVTLQTLGVMLAGVMLGPWRGAAACLLYLALAAIGLPVLPGGRGGLGVFAGPTGGFLVGMLLGVIVAGLVARALVRGGMWRALGAYVLACLLGGIAAVYAIGVPWLAAVTQMGLGKAAMAMVVFLPGDLAKAAVASWVAWRVERVWPMLRR
ncbi:biotin transporter BioY [Bordetella pseudohinzii]|uniref:Biotin transporter n=1 Tax=Bordetella pseudohinzii TaxID=1331258 RepID=A0A0J6CCF9_9BORD|nr:biotin transporter BioY [Bordetella pseudohinzii]ANY15439.1 BioY family transporter [Bordetella pseudohinzii]KMM27247.1 biotin biosynthesis protein BioC [Bordetella pseudohinzii]KXA79448.1 BioY family transporter [Bordetella pseudohinzii]KXA82566.1 BioY family transporter [Bordetella pseudohinzii]CUI85460.1 Biotin ECF transporter S component BioY [Bordetella pseudohinzii]